ncbi:nucleoside phosphorylase [Streptomyces sp. NPDC087532]|uniref:nucleoside phosphorylase n=1 Tax=unclassified Streptomyces TaxID=2593676 RepID=UPI00341A5D9D
MNRPIRLPGIQKHALPSVTDPAEHSAYIRRRYPDANLTSAAGVVLVYQASALREVLAQVEVRPLDRWVSGDLHMTNSNVVICSNFGRGAPAAGLVLEQLVAHGARSVISVGTAATLTPALHTGDLVLCKEALRGEGLSHHYLPPGRYVAADEALTAHLRSELTALDGSAPPSLGRTWTTDAIYRETLAEVHEYVTEGVLTADMEAAGMFAVAQYRGIPAAAAFTIADSLAHRQPRTDSPKIGAGLATLLNAALRALAAAPPRQRPENRRPAP